jgi:hypothetical protein
MARMWEYRDDHEREESREKAREKHAAALNEMKERRRRERANEREKVLALRKAEPMEQVTMSEQSQQYVTVEQFNKLVEKYKSLAQFVNKLVSNFNELNQQVEQLKPQPKFKGRNAELEAEVADVQPAKKAANVG